jgi:hypothetical protein
MTLGNPRNIIPLSLMMLLCMFPAFIFLKMRMIP